jgi:hypothetical protein
MLQSRKRIAGINRVGSVALAGLGLLGFCSINLVILGFILASIQDLGAKILDGEPTLLNPLPSPPFSFQGEYHTSASESTGLGIS